MKKTKKTPSEASSKSSARRKNGGLTELETEIMQVVWGREPVTAAEVREALIAHRPLALTTVITVLERLRKKDMVHAVPTVERSRRYRASVAKEDVADNLLGNLLRRFFNDSPASLVAHIMGRESIDEVEMKAIANLFKKNSSGGKKGG